MRAVLRPRHGARRGQTIVIALLVLLLLAFLGGLFATIVTHNLANAARSNRVQTADYYAEAGIRFANDQLTDSLDGADWRPPLQAQLGDGTNNTPNVLPRDTYALARYNAIKGTLRTFATIANDPDRDYLVQGFARYNIGGGRYLLRVTYDPVGLNNQDNTSTTNPYTDPRARYLKIESVGREGTVDINDPTTYTNIPRTQLNATLVQYKAIGITDYARFETNPDNRSDIMSLGVASQYEKAANAIVTPGVFDFAAGGGTGLTQYDIPTVYGASDAYLTSGANFLPNPQAGSGTANAIPGGGSIHVNGSVRFFGENIIYLSNNASNSGTFGDTAEVAGNLLLDNYTPGAAVNTELTTGQDAALIVNPPTTGTTPATSYVAPSNDSFGFSTIGGKVRDGNGGTDASGQPRSVNRLEPPTLDTVNPVTNLPRYASIAQNATPRVTENTANGTPTNYIANSSAFGYGQSIYIDNSTDVQRESSNIVGGYTLIDEWLHRAGADSATGGKGGWVANFYRPPGVDIVLGRQTANFTANNNPVSFYGIRMTRSDTDGAGNLIGWKNPDGTAISGVNADGTTQSTMTVSYKSLNASNDLTAAANPANPNNDVVIYAAGNIRVHGVVSADPADKNDPTTYGAADDQLPRHITIVTDGTAYIDGSLLRGNGQSSISVLAHDYVCVNTTQFLAGPIVDQNPYGTTPPGAFVGDLTLRALDFGASDEELIQELSLVPTSGQDPHLYVSGGPGAAGNVAADFDLIDSRTGGNLVNNANPPFTNLTPYPAGSTPVIPTPFIGLFSSIGAGAPSIFHTTFDLGTDLTNVTQSQIIDLAIRRDQGADSIFNNLDTQDFVLERAAVLPMNIRIEATLFAQTRSFFVIPGEWFNTDTTDTLTNYTGGNPRPNMLGQVVNATDVADKNRFPFFGQPIDMKVTIDGSVSEARPADISAQSAWMTKWGWIPQYRGGLNGNNGATTETTTRTAFDTANPLGVGLQIIYNPLAGFPYDGTHYLRTDIYGRPLPYAPKLPVCTGLLYAGQNDSESVLQ